VCLRVCNVCECVWYVFLCVLVCVCDCVYVSVYVSVNGLGGYVFLYDFWEGVGVVCVRRCVCAVCVVHVCSVCVVVCVCDFSVWYL
jgi:hypothetical protein